jgi:hypothetical protein
MDSRNLLERLETTHRHLLQGQVLHLAVGQPCALAEGRAWFPLSGLLGVRGSLSAAALPMALVGAGSWLACMPGAQLHVLHGMTLCELDWPPSGQTPVMSRWLQLCATRALELQGQMAHWAACYRSGPAHALLAAWCLQAQYLAGGEPLGWSWAQLQFALGWTGDALSRAGAQLADCDALHLKDGTLQVADMARLKAAAGACQLPSSDGLAALASDSATLMPSTPADKMPPA